MCTECVRGHGYECEWERSCRQRSREAERGCVRSRMGEGTLGCPSFCFRERACTGTGTGTGRTGSRHAELREDTAHVQSAALSSVQSQPLTHVMPQRLWSPKGLDKCREGEQSPVAIRRLCFLSLCRPKVISGPDSSSLSLAGSRNHAPIL